jgi:hypothetical protein
MIGELRDMTFDAKGRAILSLTLDTDFREEYDRLKGKRLDIGLKEYKPKRSCEANRYMWTLCEKIAENQGVTKEEVYRKNVREVGVFTTLTLAATAYDKFSDEWKRRGIGWFIDLIGTNGPYVDIFAYYGSSTYDTKQMSRLIKSIIEDAQALGIPTETPAELALLLAN